MDHEQRQRWRDVYEPWYPRDVVVQLLNALDAAEAEVARLNDNWRSAAIAYEKERDAARAECQRLAGQLAASRENATRAIAGFSGTLDERDTVEAANARLREQVAAKTDVHALMSWVVAATHSPAETIPADWRERPQVADVLALRARVQRLEEALDALQDHHCGGMCEKDHDAVMAKVNAALAEPAE